jgi:hypothetical protein
MQSETVLRFLLVAKIARAILLVLVVTSLVLVLLGRIRQADEAAPIGGTGHPAPGHSLLGPVPV